MPLASLFVVSSLGCITLQEPDIDYCVYLGEKKAHCIPVLGERPEYEREIEVGDIFSSPEHFSEGRKHHEELHERLNGKK